ncbi:MAG: MFS transporter, partial [Bifidobacteriaceae bacterium]|nr:MFS transporter [Bifidobacteriaceae bacterium]
MTAPIGGAMPRRARVRHDRLTLTCYSVGCCWGFLMYGYSATMPQLTKSLHVSKAVAGLHGTMFALGLLIAALAIAPVVARTGRRRAMILGLGLGAVGTLAMALGPTVWITVPGALLGSIGTQASMAAAMTVLSVHQGPAAGASTAELTMIGSVLSGCAPALAALAAALGYGWRPVIALGALIDVAVALALWRLPDSPE